MEHWQQTFLRTDPWQSIPFATDASMNIDSWVGAACIACAVLVWIFGG